MNNFHEDPHSSGSALHPNPKPVINLHGLRIYFNEFCRENTIDISTMPGSSLVVETPSIKTHV